MADVMLIAGKVENIFDEEDFARMLRDRLGDDAEQYFRDHCDIDAIMAGIDDFSPYCCGECDKVDELESEHAAKLHEICDELEEWDFDGLTKHELEKKRDALWKKIYSDL